MSPPLAPTAALVYPVSHSTRAHLHSELWISCDSGIFDVLLFPLLRNCTILLPAYVSPHHRFPFHPYLFPVFTPVLPHPQFACLLTHTFDNVARPLIVYKALCMYINRLVVSLLGHGNGGFCPRVFSSSLHAIAFVFPRLQPFDVDSEPPCLAASISQRSSPSPFSSSCLRFTPLSSISSLVLLSSRGVSILGLATFSPSSQPFWTQVCLAISLASPLSSHQEEGKILCSGKWK